MNTTNPPIRGQSRPKEKTPEELASSVVEEATPENSQKFLAFCQEQIDKMIAASKLRCQDGMPGFYELNNALMDFQSVNNGLIYLYELAKDEEFKASEAFEDWYSEKYCVERDILNPRDLAAQKWQGQREIDLHIRKKYKADYKKFNTAKSYATMQVAFLRRLLDGWERQQFILARLSKNVEAEVRGTMGRTAYTDDGSD